MKSEVMGIMFALVFFAYIGLRILVWVLSSPVASFIAVLIGIIVIGCRNGEQG